MFTHEKNQQDITPIFKIEKVVAHSPATHPKVSPKVSDTVMQVSDTSGNVIGSNQL